MPVYARALVSRAFNNGENDSIECQATQTNSPISLEERPNFGASMARTLIHMATGGDRLIVFFAF